LKITASVLQREQEELKRKKAAKRKERQKQEQKKLNKWVDECLQHDFGQQLFLLNKDEISGVLIQSCRFKTGINNLWTIADKLARRGDKLLPLKKLSLPIRLGENAITKRFINELEDNGYYTHFYSFDETYYLRIWWGE